MDTPLIIRKAREEDAEASVEFVNHILTTSEFVLTLPEEFTKTIAEQKEWIRTSALDSGMLLLIAEWDGKVVGFLDFAVKKHMKTKHSGEFGISVHPDFRGRGIARKMINFLLQWASENGKIRKIILHVLENNQMAINLYRSLGFIEESRQVRAICQTDGQYLDLIGMYKWI